MKAWPSLWMSNHEDCDLLLRNARKSKPTMNDPFDIPPDPTPSWTVHIWNPVNRLALRHIMKDKNFGQEGVQVAPGGKIARFATWEAWTAYWAVVEAVGEVILKGMQEPLWWVGGEEEEEE